jgi:hypothetical protein
MSFLRYQSFFNADKTPIPVKVLRARNVSLILSFLQENFKDKDYSSSISNEILVDKLTDFLETWNIGEEDGDISGLGLSYEEKAIKYIKDWVKEGYLSLYTDDKGQDLHSLTPEMESVLDWVDSLMKKKSFVGTESRFLDILHKLQELVQNTSDDWEAKVRELEDRKLEIDEQIRQLKTDKTIQTFEDYQIKSRFHDVNVVARSLMRDFREVETNFQDITRNIYQKQVEQNQTKGGLLGFALDALDELKITDQGRSFEAFYFHLNDPQQKQELDKLIKKVFELMQDRDILPEDKFLKKIWLYLNIEGRKVNESFDSLMKKLQKIISEKNVMERRKSLMLINEIKTLAFEVINKLPQNMVFLEIDDSADYISTDFYVSLEERETKILPRSLSVVKDDSTIDLEQLMSKTVDKSILLANIKLLLRENSQVTLKKVVDEFGLKYGLSELMAYGGIAAQSEKHLINDNQKEAFEISFGRIVEFPEIIFCR